ncbi:unnamed protein product [Protopolystoma xenopodis]|uniref:Uncharacterized protein n=1 Tax=Protopolystoma xenopodis TaxID=117903 RepID=A0A448WPW4_9PLAT|nr:unnamed protein product [Protopolystoma xenopodis]
MRAFRSCASAMAARQKPPSVANLSRSRWFCVSVLVEREGSRMGGGQAAPVTKLGFGEASLYRWDDS